MGGGGWSGEEHVMQKQFTPYPEVNMVLDVLVSEVQSILGSDHGPASFRETGPSGSQFVGMYLYGSLAYGGFDADSDVDYVVVTKDDLSEVHFSALQEMHARVAKVDSWCATQLEGSYVPQHALRTFDPLRVLFNHIDRGPNEQLHRMEIKDEKNSRAWWGGWVILRAILLESGITIAGPLPAALMDRVTGEELRQANLADLQNWFEPMCENTIQLENFGYQPYAVLTLCRILHTHERGTIVSKEDAAKWAQEKLEEPWSSLVTRAWTARHHPEIKASPDEIKLTQDFIRFALERCQ
jgi:predicted nucleotidyltransferase